MKTSSELEQLNNKILDVKRLLSEIAQEAEDFPALLRNSKRALTSVKMLELNLSDVISVDSI
jgi:archaellum component FlaC